jgi:nucleotidyltransferase/DNA polymerase involved in DNA repair
MADIGIKTVGEVREDLTTLEGYFGGRGTRLFQVARGVDHIPVVSNRVRKQIFRRRHNDGGIILPKIPTARVKCMISQVGQAGL